MNRKKWMGRLAGWVLPLALLGVWFGVSAFGVLPEYLLPSPQKLVLILIDFITGIGDKSAYSGSFLVHMTASLGRVIAGFTLASVLGIGLGFLCGGVPALRRLLDPTLNAIRSVPGIGWLPVAIVWFGIGEANTLFLISLAAFFPIYLNTLLGASQVPKQLIQAGQMLGAGKVALFRSVVFPSAFPQVVAGLRLGLGISWAYLVLGEMTGVSKGLGAVMADSRMLGRIDLILICMVLIAVAGKLSDLILIKLSCLPYGGRGLKTHGK